MKKTVTYGIIGFGRYAENRLYPAFQECHHSALGAIQKRHLSQAREMAEKLGVPAAYARPEELAADSRLDAVIVCSPPALHREHAILAARAGKHVLVEKPIATHAAEVAEIIDACRENHVLFMAGFVMRFIEAIGKMRELVQAGRIGRVEYVQGHFTLDVSSSPREWLTDPRVSGGGPVADIGVHLLDLMEFILNKRIRSLKAMVQPPFSRRNIERRGAALLDFGDGTLGDLYVSFDLFRESGLTFFGSRGKLSAVNFNSPLQEVTIEWQKGDEVLKIPVNNSYYYSRMLDHFARAILLGEPLQTSGEAALHSQQLIDAIYRDGRKNGDNLMRGK